MMKRQRLLTICACAILFSMAASHPTYSWQSSARQLTGKIKGLVLDRNDARIVGATITIESSPKMGFKRQLISGEAGNFEIKVPAGVYYLTVTANGFRRFEGWELKVNPKVTEMINIHLEVATYSQ
jgi:hypothetical protein